MTPRKTEIDRADILPWGVYAAERKARRTAMVEIKKNRRLSVGPFATFHFESYDTMLQQVQEMLHIEKGGETQIADELRAYNPLIPKGGDLSATLMFEIDDPARRGRELSRLGGVEKLVDLRFADRRVTARAEDDVERTTADGKTSAVHFLHFDLTADQIAAFKTPGTQILVAISHPDYGHLAIMPETMRAALAEDLD